VRVLPIHFGVVLGCKGGGGRKNFSGPEKIFQTQASKTGSTGKTSQDNPTQAKGSLQGQMTFSESGWRLAEAININLGDPVRVQISLGPHYICPRHGISAVNNLFFVFFWEIV
jgi:hypothetical protein